MVVARLVGLVGGSATFAQVLLSLPMTLDLLGMYNYSPSEGQKPLLTAFQVHHHSCYYLCCSRYIISYIQR